MAALSFGGSRSSRRYVGDMSPKVEHSEDPGMTYLERRAEEPEQDYLDIDDQGLDLFKENE